MPWCPAIRHFVVKNCFGHHSESLDGFFVVFFLLNRYAMVLRIFDFYASLGSGDPFMMHIVAWGQMLEETGVSGKFKLQKHDGSTDQDDF